MFKNRTPLPGTRPLLVEGDVCGMAGEEGKEDGVAMTMGQFTLHLRQIDAPLDRGTAFGRIAFACPDDQLKAIESSAVGGGGSINTPFVSLDTKDKATVNVVIVADPDLHEICFVGEAGFGELSKIDANADSLLQKAIEEDGSSEWFDKKGGKKQM